MEIVGKAGVSDEPENAASDALRNRDVRTFTQGSYRNNTNVRQDSDVDIAVVCYDVFFPDYPDGTTKETFGNIDGNYAYAMFKNEVEQALVARFGRAAVERGNKAFDFQVFSSKRKLRGRHWTERKTTGEMEFRFHSSGILEELPPELGRHPMTQETGNR